MDSSTAFCYFCKKIFAKTIDKYPDFGYNNQALGKTEKINGLVVQLVRTLACHARGRRFEPVPGRHEKASRHGLLFQYAVMAQLAEHVLGKDEVTGSNPVNSSKDKDHRKMVLIFVCPFFRQTISPHLVIISLI